MIRRLRLKFVLMNMAFVSVLLAAVFAVVLHNTQNQLAQASLRALEQAALEHLGPVRPDRRPGEPGGIPCFVLRTGPRGELIAIGDGYYDLTDEDWLLTLLAVAQEQGGREGVLENPLKLSEVDGGLYMLFGGVEIRTLVSSPALVGDRTGWTLQELRDAFAAMPEGSTIMSFNTSREEIAGFLMRYSVEAYVDREAGTCSFDDPSFRSLMEFVQMLPGIEEVEEEIGGIDYIDVVRDARSRQQKGLQLLEEIDMSFRELQIQDMLWGGRCAMIGYPTEDGSGGSMFRPRGPQLGISATCGNKEAAWEFVRTVMTNPSGESFDTPLKRDQYEMKRNAAMTVKAPLDFDPVTHEEITAPPLTEERAGEFDDFFNSIDKIDIWDGSLISLIQEICDPYFAGAKDLDETIRLLQNRVGLYLNEQM